MSSNGEIDDLTAPYGRQSRRPSNESNKYGTNPNHTPTKQTITPQKQSADSGVDSRYSVSPPDNRPTTFSNRLRSNGQVENSLGHETATKERTNTGNICNI